MIGPKIRKELEDAEKELNSIDSQLSSSNLSSNSIKELSKKRSSISELVGYFQELKSIESSIIENQNLSDDIDLRELAEEELKSLEGQLKEVEKKIEDEFKPKDPMDSKN